MSELQGVKSELEEIRQVEDQGAGNQSLKKAFSKAKALPRTLKEACASEQTFFFKQPLVTLVNRPNTTAW